MKRFLIILLIASTFVGCHDSDIKPSALTSFNITNAVIGGNTLTLNSVGPNISNNGYTQCTLFAGQTAIKLGDTSQHLQQVYYSNTVTTVNGSYYSLFLTGASPTQVDDVLIKESYTNYTNSVAGVRFINLSPGSSPVSVDIAGNANGSEVGSLAYKAYTTFKKYPVSSSGTQLNFEFRDAANGNLIASYNLTLPTYHNETLALVGTENNNPSVIAINEF